MEIDKQFQKLNQTRNSFENAIKKDLESIVNLLKIQYDIYERGTKNDVSKDKLMTEILQLFEFTQPIRICCGITKMRTRCTKRSMPGLDYCKAHMYNQYTTSLHPEESAKLYVMTDTKTEMVDSQSFGNGVEKKMVDGTFYYVDSEYIYDMDSFEKVGYVDENLTEHIKYVLTDDPFVLS